LLEQHACGLAGGRRGDRRCVERGALVGERFVFGDRFVLRDWVVVRKQLRRELGERFGGRLTVVGRKWRVVFRAERGRFRR
jgi:hypothetical protein